MTARPENEFESLARDMLSRNPDIGHEWRPQTSRLSGDRLDLVCSPGTDDEVWASLRQGQIAVGDNRSHTDFEEFGRGLSALDIAKEALEHFRGLLQQHGHSAAA